jgi:hypothetical protein
MWSVDCSVRNTTVDTTLQKRYSADYAAVGGGDPTIYPLPPYGHILSYPYACVVASGNCSIEDVHCEGAVVGVVVAESSATGAVKVSNITAEGMMDKARGAVYVFDGRSGAPPPVNSDAYGYGCAVLIGKFWKGFAPLLNDKDSVTLQAISARGMCPYIMRDERYGKNISAYGHGQFPEGGDGHVAFYARGNTYGPRTLNTEPADIWTVGSPNVDRTYFVGPLY